MPQPTDSLPADVLTALEQGDTIDAIRKLRAARGIGLKEAKDILDRYRRGEPVSFAEPAHSAAAPEGALPREVEEAMRQGRKIEAIRLLRARTGLGLAEAKAAVERLPSTRASEVGDAPSGPREGSGASPLLWAVALAVVGLVAYYAYWLGLA